MKKSKSFPYILALLTITGVLTYLANPSAVRNLIQVVVYWFSVAMVAFSLFLAVTAYFWLLERRENLLSARAERKQKELTIITARQGEQVFIKDNDPVRVWQPLHLSAQTHINGTGAKPSNLELANWATFHKRGATARVPESPDEESEELPAILPILSTAQRAIIAGASNTGKTTLLQHLIAVRSETSKIILIDPHGQRPKYGKKIDARGCGLNWAEINQTLEAVDWLMIERYREIEQGAEHRSHEPLTLIIDELMAIMDVGQRGEQAKRNATIIKRLATQARKAAIDVILVAHSLRVSQTGLKGANDLLGNFEVCELHKEAGHRTCFLHRHKPGGKKELIEHSLPGIFSQSNDVKPASIFFLPEPPEPEERHILTAIEDGGSNSMAAIARRAGISVSVHSNKKIKAISTKYGLKLP